MRRAIELRQGELEDLEDTKCRRKSYAMAQREALPIPLPLPAYPPPKPIARPPPPKTVFRPVGPRARGYRPSASANPLPSMPEVPSTPPIRNQELHGKSTLASTQEEPSVGTPNQQLNRPNTHKGNGYIGPGAHLTPDASPTLSTPQSRRPQQPPPPPPRTIIPAAETTSITDIIPNQLTSGSLPPTPPTHHLPPTPTSLSRSTTPTSLTCPRTPTSIRPAPWQPSTPISHNQRISSSPTVAAVNRTSEGYPPTPPSSPLHSGLSDVTPSSSLSSSLDQGLGHSRLSLGSSQTLPDIGPLQEEEEAASKYSSSSSCLDKVDGSYPAILDVMHLNVDVHKEDPMRGNTGHPKTIESFHNDLHRDPLSDPVTELTKGTVTGDGFVPNNFYVQEPNGRKESHQDQTYQAYRSRFWILALFSATAFLQSTVWGTFGSIAESAEVAFPNWTDATIAAFPNWGPVVVVICTIPMMWVTQRLGLRHGMIACTVLISAGTLLRCVTSQEQPFTILCHISSILNAFAACLTLSLPAMVAATWFPPDERTTATAVGALWCQLGGAAIYMGPLIVRAPHIHINSTSLSIITGEASPEDIKSDIMTLMYIHFGAAVTLLIAVFAYFPAKPPTPPSASSAEEKIDFMAGVKAVAKNMQLILVIIVYSFSFGVPVVWIGVLTFSLKEINIHQDEAMGVAVVAVVCSGVFAFITARITDKIYGHLKITIIGLLIASALFFLWFVLLSTQVIESSLAQAYMSVAGGVSFEYASVPLLVELAVELGYPIPESVMGAVLTLLFNIVALVFLGIFQIPDIGYTWVSYVLLACVSLTVIPLFFVKETHKRFETDQKERTEDAS